MWTKVIDGHLEIFGKILSLLKNQSTTQYHNRLVKIYLNLTSILLFLVLTCRRQTVSSPIIVRFFVRFLNIILQHFTLTRKLRFVPFPAKDGKVFEKKHRQTDMRKCFKLCCYILSWPAFLLHVIWNICVKNTYTHFIFIESEELHACKI